MFMVHSNHCLWYLRNLLHLRAVIQLVNIFIMLPVLTTMFRGTDQVWRLSFIFCQSKSVEQPAEVCQGREQLFTVLTVT